MKSRRSPGASGAARKRLRSTPLGITTLGTPTISASFSDITTTRGNCRRARVSKRRHRQKAHAAERARRRRAHARELPEGTAFEAAPAEDVPRGGKRALAARDLLEQVESDVMFHQDVAAVLRAVLGELRVLHL